MRPEVAERLRPAAVGWFGHARPFDFEFGPIEYAEGIARFTGGTHNVPSAYAASAGYQAVLAAGVERIRARSQWLTQRLLEGALERGWAVRSPLEPAQRGGHVTVDPGRSSEVHDALVARRIVVDHRPGAGIRIGPHFFTTADEIDLVLDAIAEARQALG
jgi:kynureninase